MSARSTSASLRSPRAARGVASSAALLVLGSVLGCRAVGPDHEAPDASLPLRWSDASAPALRGAPAELASWWRRLEDPVLDELVGRAVGSGLDVREALARVREARALRGAAAADRLPSLDAGASYERRGESDNSPFGSFVPDHDLFRAGFDAAWELDLWGRVARSVEAADADLAASVEDARDVAVTVAAETAARYVELRAFRTRLAIARTNVALQEETLGIARARFEAGLVGERDVAQASANLATTRSRVPALEVGARAAENRLAVLLGEAPGALADELAGDRAIPRPPAEVAVGVPADLLRRRADVRREERRLAAETARIGIATADLYPRFAIGARLGLEADDASDLFESASGTFGLGPSVDWNLFDGGARRRRIAAQDARAEQALVRWERTVLVALEEAENAQSAFVREQTRREALAEAALEARRAAGFARTQYQEGLADFQAVIDTERAVATLEDELAATDASIATSLISLYKALGGGFERDLELALGH